MKVAVVGATGLVGSKMLQILEERNFPVSELIPVASEKSVGKKIIFKGKEYAVVSATDAIAQKPVIALFSAGGEMSKTWAPLFAQAGIRVIDNSSAWRMEEHIKLVVPEVNAHVLKEKDYIIANPNCSTIQLVVALKPLHDNLKIKRLVISTYQSVTGTGVKAVQQLQNERVSIEGEKAYPYTIDMNAIPHIDVFMENGYSKEEMKMIWETKKIMGDNTIAITSTTVRIPVIGGHSESVNIEFERDFTIPQIKELLEKAPGVTVQDNLESLIYPMPILAHDKDDVFVGRIRRDESQPNTLNCWIVSDNLRKGAATNAVQIAEVLLEKKIITN
ncbi:MAG: aspartate-semialdehyde dehydrogenase [Chitinophagaceae bacterium]